MKRVLPIILCLMASSCIFEYDKEHLADNFSYGWIDLEKTSTIYYKEEGIVRAYCYDMLYNDTIVITKAHPRTIEEPNESITQYYILKKSLLDHCPNLAYQDCVMGPLTKQEMLSSVPENLKVIELERMTRDGDYSVNRSISTLDEFLDE